MVWRYCAGTTDSGALIAPNDPNWERLTALSAEARTNPVRWLSMEEVYGDLAQHAGFAARFAQHLTDVWARGTTAVLTDYLAR
jgi:mannitol 2-dehydrogenase